ncbi:MAG: hypothetical protein CMM49_05180 [Rhodospirillaceae bacterium]|nr:hypothetical protein [Rhodospirillaceae bacterium]|tara:strand:- start:43014 stop:43208 length:195 start_codon:yes stop_codon:yes gene_type:complete
MSIFFSILILFVSVIILAAVSAAFISVYEKFFGSEPKKITLVIVNVIILVLSYYFIISPLIVKN